MQFLRERHIKRKGQGSVAAIPASSEARFCLAFADKKTGSESVPEGSAGTESAKSESEWRASYQRGRWERTRFKSDMTQDSKASVRPLLLSRPQVRAIPCHCRALCFSLPRPEVIVVLCCVIAVLYCALHVDAEACLQPCTLTLRLQPCTVK